MWQVEQQPDQRAVQKRLGLAVEVHREEAILDRWVTESLIYTSNHYYYFQILQELLVRTDLSLKVYYMLSVAFQKKAWDVKVKQMWNEDVKVAHVSILVSNCCTLCMFLRSVWGSGSLDVGWRSDAVLLQTEGVRVHRRLGLRAGWKPQKLDLHRLLPRNSTHIHLFIAGSLSLRDTVTAVVIPTSVWTCSIHF